MQQRMTPPVRPVLVDTAEACSALGNLGRTKLFELLATGELASVKVGRRRMIPYSALEEFAQRLANDANSAA